MVRFLQIVIELVCRIGLEIVVAKVSRTSRDNLPQSYSFEPATRDGSHDLIAEQPALVKQTVARESADPHTRGRHPLMAVHVLNSMPPLIQVGIRTNTHRH